MNGSSSNNHIFRNALALATFMSTNLDTVFKDKFGPLCSCSIENEIKKHYFLCTIS